MSTTPAFRVLLLLAAVSLPAATGTPPAGAADPPGAAPRAARGESSVPRLYVATGPSSEADLARLRASVGRLAGVTKVEARAEFGAVTVHIDGDGSSTESLLAAAARSAGFTMRPARPRFFAADGPTGESDLDRLRAALGKVYGVEEVALDERTGGAAVRLLGVMERAALTAAGKSAGFELREVGSYIVSGPTADADLARLRAALGKVAGVERLEMKSLAGGATLLIQGTVSDPRLAAAAKAEGYDLWPLGSARGPREFRIDGRPAADAEKLRQALQALEGIGELEIRAAPGGQRLFVTGGRARPDGILAAAAGAGFTLTAVEAPVTLPTLLPEAGRSTPPDYDARVLEEKANLGQPAPGFAVLGTDGRTKRSLSDCLAAGKPVVLIFGSCTCPRFMAACGPLEQLYQTYKDRVTFLLIYLQEAHPGAILSVATESGGKELRVIPLITKEAESLENLRKLVQLGKLTIPAGIESPANSVNRDYAGYPNRLYVVTTDGRVAFKGAPGPTGLKVPDLADWLRDNVK